jgi:hypothetical protein
VVAAATGLAAMGLPATRAWAQGAVLRGEVVHADGRTPAAAVLIEAQGAPGTVVARVLSGSDGTFRLELASPGTVRVRALRVGFRPTVVENVRVGSEQRQLRIVLGSDVVRFPAARVTTADVCGIRSDSGALVATAWEEVRKAIASASAAAAGARFAAEVLNWRSIHALDGSGPLWQEHERVLLDSPRPYVGIAADSAAVRGYSRTAPGGAVDYFGPDAETLISEAFAASHCFRIAAPDVGHPNWIGIAFRPARGGGGIVEIAGTFWVDTATTALRLLEYRYTSAPPEFSRIGAGGLIEFDRLRTGEWLVRRWAIRLATTDASRTESHHLRMGRGSAVPTRAAGALLAQHSGGDVMAVRGESDVVLGQPAPTWRARLLRDGTPVGPDDGATVEFVAPPRFVVADSAGGVSAALRPGQHTLIASTHVQRGLLLPGLRQVVNVTDGEQPATAIALPTPTQLLVQRCGSSAEARGQAALFGRETPPNPELDPPSVAVDWIARDERNGPAGRRWATDSISIAGGRMRVGGDHLTTPDGLGRWYVCGVPRGSTVRLVIVRPDGSPGGVSYVRIREADRGVEAGPVGLRVP